MRRAYYSEHEPYAAQWLANLIAAGHIPEGTVDARDLRDLTPDDVMDRDFHAFAGIGVWAYALRRAGLTATGPVWTGSCPCQPFSQAGRRGGFADERHLWPTWFALIRECRPAVVFGEQVAGPDGRAWLDAVSADLEGAGYAIGAANLCAAGVGAPHIRQRLFFVAYAAGKGWEGRQGFTGDDGEEPVATERDGDATRGRSDASSTGGRGGARAIFGAQAEGSSEWIESRRVADFAFVAGATRGYWADCDWWHGSDGKHRPIEPGVFPLAHGTANRVGKLRAYGNAIVAPLAVEFIRAATEAAMTLQAHGAQGTHRCGQGG